MRECVRAYLLYGQNDVLKVWILMENNNNLLSFGLRCGDSIFIPCSVEQSESERGEES